MSSKSSKGPSRLLNSKRGRGKNYPLMAVRVLILILTKNDGFKGIRAVIDALAAQRQKTLRRSSAQVNYPPKAPPRVVSTVLFQQISPSINRRRAAYISTTLWVELPLDQL